MNYYIEIKEQIVNNEITKRVKDYSKNRSDLNTYYNVGKLLSEAGKHYGEGIIKEYSIRLIKEFGKGYTQSRLRYFRRFFEVFSKCPTMSDKLSYSRYCEIIWLEQPQINYYISLCSNLNLSVRELRNKVKSNEYERLDESTKLKLIKEDKLEVGDLMPNPIVINNKNNYVDISEKILQKMILEDIPSFLEELGSGFTFIKNEIKNKLIDNEVYSKIKDYSKERYKVTTYFEIGKLLSEAGKQYGKNIIKQYSQKLVIDVGKKYNERTLYGMRKFYEIFSDEKLNPLGSKLSWSHYRELL